MSDADDVRVLPMAPPTLSYTADPHHDGDARPECRCAALEAEADRRRDDGPGGDK